VRECQTPLSHHLDKIPQAKLVAQVPANTQKDDLAIKVSPIEQLVQALQLTHYRSSVRVVRRLQPVHCLHLHQNRRGTERQSKSPRELMTGQDHPHWLTLLGLGPLQPQRS
jgi:hypothetical protein